MWPRFNNKDLRIIAHYLGMFVILLGALMVVPLVVSLLFAEWAVSCHYVFGIGATLAVGSLLRLACVGPRKLGRKHAIAITGLAWIVGAVIAAVPLALSGHYATMLDAVFEGVSGLTATGLTLVQDVDHLSAADTMWRFTLQLVGGQGVIVVALSLGLFARTGTSLYASEGREESVVPSIKNTTRFIWKFATAAVALGTVVLTVILIVMGMNPAQGFFHGLWITIGAYDTGGFAPTSLSLMAYHSWPIEFIAMLLMLFGALNFALIAAVHKGNWRAFLRDIEVRTLALWITGMVVVFVAALAVGDFLTDYSGLMRRGIFTIVSAATNSGYQVLSTGQINTLLTSGAFFLVAVAMAIGGSSASTAGGIKALRVGLIFKGIGMRVRSILLPRSAHITSSYYHIGRQQLSAELLSSALIIAALYVVTYVIGALAGIACGYDALSATFESISATSNAGLSSGVVSAGMPVPLELLYLLQMWLGRLEFLTLLALAAMCIASLVPRRRPRNGEGRVERTRLRPVKAGWRNKRGSARVVATGVLALLLLGGLLAAPAVHGYANEPAGSYASSPSPSYANELPRNAPQAQPDGASITISELALAPEHLNRQIVSFEGEVVGALINADAGRRWAQLNDGHASISVLLSGADAALIAYTGGYAQLGTQLTVQGEFHLACDEHDGLSDVHALSVAVREPGGPVPVAVEPEHPYLFVGLALMVLAGVFLVIFSRLSKRLR